MKITMIASAVLACALMTGCEGSVEGGIERKDSSNGVSETTLSLKFVLKSKSIIDVSMLAVDLHATNALVVDGNGTGSITLFQNGYTVGVGHFDYAVIDGMALVSNPASVNAWLAGYPNVDDYQVELGGITTVDTEAGTASLTADTVYDGYTYSSSSTFWTSAGDGGGCGGQPGGGIGDGGIHPEMPIIC